MSALEQPLSSTNCHEHDAVRASSPKQEADAKRQPGSEHEVAAVENSALHLHLPQPLPAGDGIGLGAQADADGEQVGAVTINLVRVDNLDSDICSCNSIGDWLIEQPLTVNKKTH